MEGHLVNENNPLLNPHLTPTNNPHCLHKTMVHVRPHINKQPFVFNTKLLMAMQHLVIVLLCFPEHVWCIVRLVL